MKYIRKKRVKLKLVFEKSEKDYRKIHEEELNKFLDNKTGELENSKEIQNKKKDDLLVSYDFTGLYPNAPIDLKST